MSEEGFTNGKYDLKRGIDFVGVTCSFLCHDGNGRILMHKRSQNCRDEQGRWDLGAGALEHGESVKKAVEREKLMRNTVRPYKSWCSLATLTFTVN